MTRRTRWFEKKEFEHDGKLIVIKNGLNDFRITFEGNVHYIMKDDGFKSAFKNEDGNYFEDRIKSINKNKSSRKQRRENQRYYERVKSLMVKPSVTEDTKDLENLKNEATEELNKAIEENKNSSGE